MLSGGIVYEVEQENQEEESSLPTMQQGLLLCLFLQHSDPFTSQLSDVMGERNWVMQTHKTLQTASLHLFETATIQELCIIPTTVETGVSLMLLQQQRPW